jgi:hypothetical protein
MRQRSKFKDMEDVDKIFVGDNGLTNPKEDLAVPSDIIILQDH